MLFDAQLLCGTDDWLARNKPELQHRLSPGEAAEEMTLAAEGPEWRAALLPFPSSPGQAYLEENARIVAAAQAEPRFLAVAAVNPRVPENFSAVEAMAERSEIAGLAIWPILCDLDLLALAGEKRLWALAERHRLPVTVHVGTGAEPELGRAVAANRYGPLDAVTLARALPQVRFNLSHCLRLSRAALEEVAGLDNVWTDTSGLSAIGRWHEAGREVFPAADALDAGDDPHYMLVRLAEDYGLERRIMFGSSHPFSAWWHFDVHAEVDACRRQPLPPAATAAVLFRNACDFFEVPSF
jgi:predicted TIM-barrel fold metal-dependent hydrolase